MKRALWHLGTFALFGAALSLFWLLLVVTGGVQ